jgi:hypothetical protein
MHQEASNSGIEMGSRLSPLNAVAQPNDITGVDPSEEI